MTEREAPIAEPDLKARQKFAAYGNNWFHILRGQWGMRADRRILYWTGFSIVTWQFGVSAGLPYRPTLLLTTIGKRTGELRDVALPFWRVGDELIVLGTKGGGAQDPFWSKNLKAAEHCWVRYRRRNHAASGRIVQGDERVGLYEKMCELNPKLARYQESASRFGREIPLVALRLRSSEV